MTEKVKYELEFLLHTSPRVLENMLFTPAGLSEWFADDVTLKDDIITFEWEGSNETARLLNKKFTDKIKWQWSADQEEGLDTYCEMRYHVDSLTKMVVLTITDFAEEDELDEAKMLWDKQINEMKRGLGA
jgi:hypothetical protein